MRARRVLVPDLAARARRRDHPRAGPPEDQTLRTFIIQDNKGNWLQFFGK